jgi:hypothetical protein
MKYVGGRIRSNAKNKSFVTAAGTKKRAFTKKLRDEDPPG